MLVRLALAVGLLCAGGVVLSAAQSSVLTAAPTLALRVATFDVDATPALPMKATMPGFTLDSNGFEIFPSRPMRGCLRTGICA